MGTKQLKDAQAGFAGGLNTVGDPSMLSPDQARRLDNFKLSAFGAALKRNGSQKTSVAAPNPNNPILTVAFWPSQSQMFATTYIGGLFYASAGAIPGTWNSCAGYSPYNDAKFAVFVDSSALERLYWWEPNSPGTGSLYKVDGTYTATAVSGTLVVNGSYNFSGVVVYNRRLWMWTGVDNKLYYSPLDNGDGLGIASLDGGAIIVQTFGTSKIYNCLPVGASLLIFHEQGVSRLTGWGQDDINVEPQALAPDLRILGRSACAVVDGVAYTMTTRGLYRVTEQTAAPVGTPDRPDPTFPVIQSAITSGRITYRTRVGYNATTGEIIVWIPGAGMFVYNTVINAWSGPYTGPMVTALVGYGDPWALTYIPPYFYFGDDDGFLQRLEPTGVVKDSVISAGTGGTAVTGVLQPHRFFAGDRAYSKAWRWVQIMATLTDTVNDPVVTCSAVHGGTSTTTVAVTATPQDVYYVGPGGTGPYLDVVITDAGVSASQYASIGVEAYLLGQR